MENKDYYKILGVSRDADQNEIKKAFRKLVMQHHPDKHKGDKKAEQKFKDINEAYEVLKDEKKRASYDRFGTADFQQGSQGFQSGSGGFEDFGDVFGDIFSDFMGRSGRSAKKNQRGSDLKYTTSVTLEEAYSGVKRKIKFSSMKECDSCNGKGSKSSVGTINCPGCNGSGKMRYQQGFFMMERECGQCSGSGVIVKDPCSKCRGEGRATKKNELIVTIPAGITNGSRMKIANEGEAGIRNAASGDLYVYVEVQKHHFYEVEGSDLHCTVPIKMVDAVLGGSFDLPTLESKIAKITLPAGTQPGHKLRLKGKGMPILNNSKLSGDLYVHINVELPIKISDKQKELLEEFSKINTSGSSPKTENFFKKIKNFVSEMKKK